MRTSPEGPAVTRQSPLPFVNSTCTGPLTVKLRSAVPTAADCRPQPARQIAARTAVARTNGCRWWVDCVTFAFRRIALALCIPLSTIRGCAEESSLAGGGFRAHIADHRPCAERHVECGSLLPLLLGNHKAACHPSCHPERREGSLFGVRCGDAFNRREIPRPTSGLGMTT